MKSQAIWYSRYVSSCKQQFSLHKIYADSIRHKSFAYNSRIFNANDTLASTEKLINTKLSNDVHGRNIHEKWIYCILPTNRITS